MIFGKQEMNLQTRKMDKSLQKIRILEESPFLILNFHTSLVFVLNVLWVQNKPLILHIVRTIGFASFHSILEKTMVQIKIERYTI
jgi:hypothetical protein